MAKTGYHPEPEWWNLVARAHGFWAKLLWLMHAD